jgi:hypothetical protein
MAPVGIGLKGQPDSARRFQVEPDFLFKNHSGS